MLENYRNAVHKLDLVHTFSNTLLYTAAAVCILALLCGAGAWAIARRREKFFKFAYIYFIIGILVPAQALFIQIFLVGNTLHPINSRIGVICMYIVSGISFGMFMMNSFMNTVPVELEEAARIDGCSVFRTFFNVVVPVLKPAYATLIIMQSFQIWNEYLMSSLFISKKNCGLLSSVHRYCFPHSKMITVQLWRQLLSLRCQLQFCSCVFKNIL
ncbi:carbohydrate ABC transporter permease [Blautia sp. RD014234]|nr:carbohydrate ABC transporter permease [Blautia parvula]